MCAAAEMGMSDTILTRPPIDSVIMTGNEASAFFVSLMSHGTFGPDIRQYSPSSELLRCLSVIRQDWNDHFFTFLIENQVSGHVSHETRNVG